MYNIVYLYAVPTVKITHVRFCTNMSLKKKKKKKKKIGTICYPKIKRIFKIKVFSILSFQFRETAKYLYTVNCEAAECLSPGI